MQNANILTLHMFTPNLSSESTMAVNFVNTEETFVLASLKEFVKIWGSGNQATFNLECRNGNAYLRMETHLGPPGQQHYVIIISTAMADNNTILSMLVFTINLPRRKVQDRFIATMLEQLLTKLSRIWL